MGGKHKKVDIRRFNSAIAMRDGFLFHQKGKKNETKGGKKDAGKRSIEEEGASGGVEILRGGSRRMQIMGGKPDHNVRKLMSKAVSHE